MFLKLIAAALSAPLGSPGVVSIDDASSAGNLGNTAGVSFKSSGVFSRYFFSTPIDMGHWLAPQENMGDYEIRATLSSGDTPTAGTIGSWEALSTTRTWELVSVTPSESLSASVLIEIRWAGNDVVQDSATYTLTATGPSA